jgi:hypothetical protein
VYVKGVFYLFFPVNILIFLPAPGVSENFNKAQKNELPLVAAVQMLLLSFLL